MLAETEETIRRLRDQLGARALLAGLLGEIILWPDGDGLVAEIRGTLPGVGVDPYGSGGRI